MSIIKNSSRNSGPIEVSFRSPYSRLAMVIGAYVALHYSAHNINDLGFLRFVFNVILLTIFNLVAVNFIIIIVNRLKKGHQKLVMGFTFMLFAHYMGVTFFGNNTIHEYLVAPLLQLGPYAVYLIFFSIAFALGFMMSGNVQKATLVVVLLYSLPLYSLGKAIFFKLIGPKEVITYPISNQKEALKEFIFKKKDNVYFIVLDSYTSIEGLGVLGLDETPFLNGLSQRDFHLYKSFFTNFQTTRYAMPTYLNMSIKNRNDFYYQTSSSILSKIVAGEGLVYKIFKRNGYQMSIFHPNRYLLAGLPCGVSLCSPPLGWHRYFDLFMMVVPRQLYLPGVVQPNMPSQEDFAYLLAEIQERRDKNYFTYLHFYLPNHVHQILYGKCDQEQNTKEYAQRVKKANQLTVEVIDAIVRADPKAMLILASDHGPTLFHKCSMDVPLKTREEIIERQGAFLAIKWNGDYDGRFDQEVKTSANLFRYIFSHLTESDTILASKVPDDAFYQLADKSTNKSIENGHLILINKR